MIFTSYSNWVHQCSDIVVSSCIMSRMQALLYHSRISQFVTSANKWSLITGTSGKKRWTHNMHLWPPSWTVNVIDNNYNKFRLTIIRLFRNSSLCYDTRTLNEVHSYSCMSIKTKSRTLVWATRMQQNIIFIMNIIIIMS